MQKKLSAPIAHGLALLTIIIWGISFIATKKLLVVYSPVQIMLLRFAMAYLSLWILRPKAFIVPLKTELNFMLLGLIGCTVYFIMENNALRYTLASNVSILIAFAPIFIAILAHFFLKNERLSRYSVLGFIIAIFGVALVVFNGSVILKLNPLGDMLSLLAALSWAVYSILLRKNVEKYDSVLLTRRLMFWGFVTALPTGLLEKESFSLKPLANGELLICILFLGIICSGICYVFWNAANQSLGTVTVGNYVYINPLSTLIAAGIILREPISIMGICGAVLILLGVFVADRKGSASK